MHASSLTINRMHNQYLVGRAVSSVNGSKRRLDGIASDLLAQALAQALSPLLGKRPGLVLLDRLECELTLDGGLSDQTILHAWAAEIARVLSRRLRDDGSQSMACFADSDELLAAFLTDLVEGRAWQGWVYRSFDGLKMLPLSAALRTAIVDDPQRGLRVLLAMSAAQREMLISALGEAESDRVLSELGEADEVASEDPTVVAARLLAAVDDWTPYFTGRSANSLWFFLRVNAVADRHSELQYRLIREIVELKLRFRGGGEYQGRWPGYDEADAKAEDTRQLDRTQIIASLPDDLRERIERELLGSAKSRVGNPDHDRDLAHERSSWFTPHGGALLLIRFVAQWPLDTLPGLDAEHAGWLRLLILAKAMGRTRFAEVFDSPPLRELLGLAPGLTIGEVKAWLLAQPAERRRAWMGRLGDWRQAQWPSESEDQVLCNRQGLQHIVSEPVKGAWLSAVHADRLAVLRELQADIAVGRRPRNHRVLRRSLADFHYLRLAPIADESEDSDLTLSVLAQGILRDLAFSLPGFAESSLDFLYRNFLDFSARVERFGTGYQVFLSRPPLNVILNMTGLQRGRIELPGREGVDMELFPESG